jgi:hypothetical protein
LPPEEGIAAGDGTGREPEGQRYLKQVMEGFGLSNSFTVLRDGGGAAPIDRQALSEVLNDSDLFLNVNGYIRDEGVLEAARFPVFLDIDPGFAQMWKELGLADVFQGHDAFVTIAENMGKPDCEIPTGGLDWITTRQPVVLDEWRVAQRGRDVFTSVGSWRGPFDPVEYRGKRYGLRVHEFRRFARLPRLTERPFEVALDIDEADADDIGLLRDGGWSLVEPDDVARDQWQYREYVQGSRAELMVAKNMYVETRSGWFSDRSICYLASGKPVLAQDTGIRDLYPTGEGLLAFSTLEEAAAGVEAIDRDHQRHARAARGIAEEYFDSDRMLARLLRELGVA